MALLAAEGVQDQDFDLEVSIHALFMLFLDACAGAACSIPLFLHHSRAFSAAPIATHPPPPPASAPSGRCMLACRVCLGLSRPLSWQSVSTLRPGASSA